MEPLESERDVIMKKVTVLFSIFFLAAATAFAQGRGGQQGQRGQGQGAAQEQRQGQEQWQGQQQSQGGMQSGRGDMDQKRVRATKQQRDQINVCSKQADNLRKEARKMAQTPEKKFNPTEARQRSNQIRNQINTMEQEHERLMKSLDIGQQNAWQEQAQNMNRLRQEVRSQFQRLDSEVSGPNPDAARVAESARMMEQTTKDWNRQYQALLSQAQP